MAALLSRIKFELKAGTSPGAFGGTGWTDFDTDIGCIGDWSGLLSEAPIAGDIIEQDWVAGAIWQEGEAKTYSFDVPFTARVSNAVNPNIWDSWNNGVRQLRLLRGPQLMLRRTFYDSAGAIVRQDQAAGVLVTDFQPKVGIGRVIEGVAVFQNLSGGWPYLNPFYIPTP